MKFCTNLGHKLFDNIILNIAPSPGFFCDHTNKPISECDKEIR